MVIEENNTSDDHIVFDFEGMVFEPTQGTGITACSSTTIKDALSSNQNEAELLEKKKADPRFRTQVCSFWIEGRCMKGETCEFLHRYDTDKMPICRYGTDCVLKDCPFRHITEEERPECVFYRQGFCIHGPYCKYRHDKLPPTFLPEEGDFNLTLKGFNPNDPKRPRAEPNEFYKISLCKNFEKDQSCPFGDKCHFAHGAHELREYKKPKREPGSGEIPTEAGIDDLITLYQNAPVPEIIVNFASLPIEPSDLCRYFIIKSIGYKNLAVSVKKGCWATHRMHRETLNTAFATSNKIIFIFSVNESKHFQGCAQMMSPIPPDTEEQLMIGSQWTSRFHVKWLRICELPFRLVAFLTNPYNNDLSIIRSRDCQELHPSIGPKVLTLLYQQAEVELHEEAMEGDLELHTFTLPEEYDQEAYKQLQLPSHFTISPGPGFVFGCNSRTMDECMARMIFGLPAGMLQQCSGSVVVGTTLFLYNMTTKQIFGIFAATTEPRMNMEPQAWNRNMPSLGGVNISPFPVQVRIQILLECPPVPETDPALKVILANRPKMIGPLEPDQTQKLADMFATCAGVLQPSRTIGLGTTGEVKGGPKNGGWYEPRNPYYQKIFVRMQSHPGFNVASKLVGKNGETVKNIMNNCGNNTRLRLRGRGSGYREGPLSLEAPEDLHFMVSAENVETMKDAIAKTEELIETVREDYLNFLDSPASQLLGPEAEIGLMTGYSQGGPPLIGPPLAGFPPPPPPRGAPPPGPGNPFFPPF